MPNLSIVLTEPAWPDLIDKPVIHLGNDAQIAITGLVGGTMSGKPSVAMRFDLPDGQIVLAETTLSLFVTAAGALLAKYGHELEVAEDVQSVGHALGRWSHLLNELAVQSQDAERFTKEFTREDVWLLNELISFAREWHSDLVTAIGQ